MFPCDHTRHESELFKPVNFEYQIGIPKKNQDRNECMCYILSLGSVWETIKQ